MLKRFTLVIRKRLPSSIRRVLRLGKHLFFKGHSSASVPTDLLSDCRMSASRAELVGLLPRGGRIAEVGTDNGHFARLILDICDPAELHLIDLDLSMLDPIVAKDHRVVLHCRMSHLALEDFPEAYFDWIYIDGDHSYAGVTRDADAAASKVKPGGFLVFNDFAHIDPFLGAYGVHRAVVKFAITRRWRFSWFAYEPSALYDVALRRPENSH
jgi:SAM-dependent methyltransferase